MEMKGLKGFKGAKREMGSKRDQKGSQWIGEGEGGGREGPFDRNFGKVVKEEKKVKWRRALASPQALEISNIKNSKSKYWWKVDEF